MNGPNANLTPLLTEKYIFAAPADAAKTMGSLATHEAVLLLKPLKVEPVVACLNFMTPIKAAAILRRLPTRHGAQILSRLEVAQAAAVFAAFSVPQKEKIKTVLSASYVKTLQSFSAWPKDWDRMYLINVKNLDQFKFLKIIKEKHFVINQFQRSYQLMNQKKMHGVVLFNTKIFFLRK